MRKILKILFWTVVGLMSIVLIPWGIQSGSQVFQKYRPRYAPFTGSGTVIDKKTKQGIPGVYVLLKATGYREFKSLGFSPEGARSSGNWYGGQCESLHVVKTDASGHYRYSIKPDKAFTYPWPYSVGFYLEYYDSNYFYHWYQDSNTKLEHVTELTKQEDIPEQMQSYVMDDGSRNCGSFVDDGGPLRQVFILKVRNKLKWICRNQEWFMDSTPYTQGKLVARASSVRTMYARFGHLAREIDGINDGNMLPDRAPGVTENGWKRDAKNFFGEGFAEAGSEDAKVSDEQARQACEYFSTKIPK
jgi:hypothetical protein